MTDHVPSSKKRSYLILIAVQVVVLLLFTGAQVGLGKVSSSQRSEQSAQRPSTVSARLVSSDAESLQFVLELPEVDYDAQGIVSIPGLHTDVGTPGAPALPVYSTYIALPPGADATVDVALNGVRSHSASYIRPAPQPGNFPEVENVTRMAALTPEPSYEPDPAFYSSDTAYPGRTYELSEAMYYRDLRVVRLDLYPVQYNAARQTLTQAAEMIATVRFHGARLDNLKPASGDSAFLESIAPLILNFEQAQGWRSLPAGIGDTETALPTGQETFKISVVEDGVVELSYADLKAAGMNVDDVDPNTFEMMYRGEPVAYHFVGNTNAQFDPGEKIRFYGWTFDGSRLERQFLTENIYWLWAGGNATRLDTEESVSGLPLAAGFRESITREPERIFTHVWTNKWENSPNEPDAWVWQRVQKTLADPPDLEFVHVITAPAPLETGTPAIVTVEILSHANRPDHDVSIYFNGNQAISGDLQWANARSVNVTMTVPVTAVLEGANDVHVVYRTPITPLIPAPAFYFMNRISIDYDRRFVAEDDQLIFDDAGGNHSYAITGFSTDIEPLVWDITDRLRPVQIMNVGVSTAAPHVYTFGASSGPASFIATHAGNVRGPAAISKYVGPDLDPQSGAEWVAISHADFIPQAQQLAAHRSHPFFGALQTHVIDVQDVINQYGYGLPLPGAIRQYMQHAIASWPVAPQYLLLMGDGHINPRHIPCPPTAPDNNQCSHWGSEQEPNFVLTDIVYTDQEVGINASDYSYALLVGDDLLPDISVGRLAVQTLAEAKIHVDKIISYETVRLYPNQWHRNVLFVADDGESFCELNESVGNTLPAQYITRTVCLESNSDEHINQARIEISNAVNNPPNGVTFLNYRGHGAVRAWAGKLINLDSKTEDPPWTPWFNNEPLIILSMDCLDGYFAQPGYEALSEAFLAVPDHGSVAHWSSTGFGYPFQHNVLHLAFYDGLFDHNLSTIGDAVNYAKVVYTMQSQDPSQLYSFTLQGDPAMEMIESAERTYLPTLQR